MLVGEGSCGIDIWGGGVKEYRMSLLFHEQLEEFPE